MKKIINYLLYCIAAVAFLASCEKNEPILFQDSEAFVAFERTSGIVPESQTIDIQVMFVTTSNKSITVNFDFDTVGFANPAEEGVAFELLNDSKTLTFADGSGFQTISLRAIPDGIFTGNRSVNVKITDSSGGIAVGSESSFRLTINDSEHPLNLVLGTYSVTGVDWWGDPINQTIVTSPVEGNLGQVSVRLAELMPGWGVCADFLVYIDVDLDDMTFNMKAGQEFASFNACGGPNYGPSKTAGFVQGTSTAIEDGQNIRFTIASNGNITMVDHYRQVITEGGNAGLHFTIWDTVTWTKGAKNYVENDNHSELVLRSE